MKLIFDGELSAVREKLRGGVREGKTPGGLILTGGAEGLYGGAEGDSVWMMQTSSFKRGYFQRYFKGRLYEQGDRTRLEGRFVFRTGDLIAAVALAILASVFCTLRGGGPEGDFLPAFLPWLALWAVVCCVLAGASILRFQREERCVKEYLTEQGGRAPDETA